MKIYGDSQSGNCYKIQLLASILGLEYDWIDIDILANETHTPEFLAKDPNGKIPLLELNDGRCISESNAILNYLAEDSELLPKDPYMRAKVLQWQFFEQYSHEPYIAVARFIAKYLGLPEDRQAEYQAKQTGGHKALKVMEEQLSHTKYLAGETLSIADISLYAYTHVAHEGGFDLSEYPAIQLWIATIKKHINYIDMS
mgnify:CR=1 FL=1